MSFFGKGLLLEELSGKYCYLGQACNDVIEAFSYKFFIKLIVLRTLSF